MKRINVMRGIVVSALVLTGSAGTAGPNKADRSSASRDDWPLHGRDAGEQRFSPLAQITPQNIDELGVAWSADFAARSLRGVEGTPLVVGGVMYASGPWSKVMALDARTGAKLWDYDPNIDGDTARKACCDVVNRGVAYDDGRVFIGALDGRLIALDARTGKVLWTAVTVDQTKSYTITGAPRVIKGRVIIGNGGAEYGVRGYISAYDVATGTLAWRFFTVPGNPAAGFENGAMAMAAKTWTGEWWKYGGGGTAWDSMAYDPDLDLLYVGVGNGGPWNRKVRSPGGGDNLFLSSIVALRPETGEYVWHFQETPGDEWDYTATQHMILANLPIGGQPRKVLMQASKNGFFYVLDRQTGKFLSGTAFVPISWAKGLDPKTGRPNIVPEARYSETGLPFLGMPSPAGGHNWQPMSFSPKTGLVYFPVIEMPYGYVADKDSDFQYDARGWNTGQDPAKSAMPEDLAVRSKIRSMMSGKLVAWDPVEQTQKWSVPLTVPWNGGVLSTAGDLVFEGNGAGEFAAYDAAGGRKLWSVPVNSGVVAPPISYAVDGVQYVAIGVGYGGILPLNMGEALQGAIPPRVNQIIAFRLGGNAKVRAVADPTAAPYVPPPAVAGNAVVAEGHDLFHTSCWMCHGDSAVNRGGVPNLRRSPAIADPAAFKKYVLGGIATQFGMPNFTAKYSPQQVEAIRAYLIHRANDLKAHPELP
jgi:PQQ-dependent dehydrogenase (methanol/ethanol family)